VWAARTAPLRSGTASRRSRACLRTLRANGRKISRSGRSDSRPRTALTSCRGGSSRFRATQAFDGDDVQGNSQSRVSRCVEVYSFPQEPWLSDFTTVDCLRPRRQERTRRIKPPRGAENARESTPQHADMHGSARIKTRCCCCRKLSDASGWRAKHRQDAFRALVHFWTGVRKTRAPCAHHSYAADWARPRCRASEPIARLNPVNDSLGS
jgi:hypothetical protein